MRQLTLNIAPNGRSGESLEGQVLFANKEGQAQIALRHWQRIISRWPIDKVRPEAVSFQALMKKRLERYQNPSSANTITKVQGTEANAAPINLTWNENREMKQTNVLYALLENRFQKESPLPDRLRYPASEVNHYDMIIKESERAPSRSFLDKLTNRLKGMIRLR
ncbi:hypothetical protein LTR64_000838 [Lithohypha guttulata]|uniref:uncharacterized protein n=1 Tax=Lithohypha guttulata TaxID=1690604 RepID=UPI00315C6B0A